MSMSVGIANPCDFQKRRTRSNFSFASGPFSKVFTAKALYHLTGRGNAREPIFLDQKDYAKFVRATTQVFGHWTRKNASIIP